MEKKNLMNEMSESLSRVLQGGGRKVINLQRWKEMLVAKEKLDQLLEKDGGEVSTVTIFPAFCSASVSVEVDMLEIGNKDREVVIEMLKSVSNVELLPLINGQLRLAMTFKEVLHTEE